MSSHLTPQDGETALVRASYKGHLAVVQWLVCEGKADVNKQHKVSTPYPPRGRAGGRGTGGDRYRYTRRGMGFVCIHGFFHVFDVLLD